MENRCRYLENSTLFGAHSTKTYENSDKLIENSTNSVNSHDINIDSSNQKNKVMHKLKVNLQYVSDTLLEELVKLEMVADEHKTVIDTILIDEKYIQDSSTFELIYIILIL